MPPDQSSFFQEMPLQHPFADRRDRNLQRQSTDSTDQVFSHFTVPSDRVGDQLCIGKHCYPELICHMMDGMELGFQCIESHAHRQGMLSEILVSRKHRHQSQVQVLCTCSPEPKPMFVHEIEGLLGLPDRLLQHTKQNNMCGRQIGSPQQDRQVEAEVFQQEHGVRPFRVGPCKVRKPLQIEERCREIPHCCCFPSCHSPQLEMLETPIEPRPDIQIISAIGIIIIAKASQKNQGATNISPQANFEKMKHVILQNSFRCIVVVWDGAQSRC